MSACDECAHFSSYLASGRVHCVGVTRYIPKKVYTWTQRTVPLEYTDCVGKHVIVCGDYEKRASRKRNA